MARGGKEAIEHVRSLRYHLTVTEPSFTVDGVYEVDREGRMRIDILRDGKRVFTEAFDGRAGWQQGENEAHGSEASPEGSAALWHGTQSPDKLFGLHELTRRGHRVEAAGFEDVEGTRYARLKVTLSDGWETMYYLDPVTWLVARTRDHKALHVDLDPSKRPLEETLLDVRPVAGVMRSFRAVSRDLSSGAVVQTTTITGIDVNPPIDPERFRRPRRAPGGRRRSPGSRRGSSRRRR
ncbi:MAG TPA: hypothetical protein VGS03_01705 [Candidatus Polarisedimenticolia bacterium]|nr:hypothetical protein [Candidatus Polarisedimenticolia bacterium]